MRRGSVEGRESFVSWWRRGGRWFDCMAVDLKRWRKRFVLVWRWRRQCCSCRRVGRCVRRGWWVGWILGQVPHSCCSMPGHRRNPTQLLHRAAPEASCCRCHGCHAACDDALEHLAGTSSCCYRCCPGQRCRWVGEALVERSENVPPKVEP